MAMGDVSILHLASGATVRCEEHAITGRLAWHKARKIEIKIIGIRAGFGSEDRNAWIVEYPGQQLFVLSRGEFRLR